MQNDLFEIYEFYETPWYQEPWIMALIGVTILATCILVWYFLIRKKTLTPWDTALTQLNTLKPEHFQRKDEFKQFYFKLTSIVKTYVDARYGWYTKAKTDDELINWLEHEQPLHPCTSAMKTMAENVLLIKFANVDAIKSQALQDKQAIIDLIKKTKTTS